MGWDRFSKVFTLLAALGLGLVSGCGGPSSSGGAESSGDAGGDGGGGDEADGNGDDTGETGDGDGDGDGGPIEPACATPLADQVETAAIMAHLGALQQVADAAEDTRAADSPGYAASLDYLEQALSETGYTLSRHEFEHRVFQIVGPATLAQVAPTPATYTEGSDEDYVVAQFSGAGDVTATASAVAPGSADGCAAADFAGFTAGHIALVRRGGCTFVAKAQNAADAGAAAVVIYNNVPGVLAGTLGPEADLQIPVLMASGVLGDELAALVSGGLTLRVAVDAINKNATGQNLIAQSPGDTGRVVMLGAHLDSVPAGPGLNDNGSGTATLLELALRFDTCAPRHAVRFAWWGAEELGLVGSRAYVADLDDSGRDQIAVYSNFDMVASPNYVLFVHDGDGSDTGAGGPGGSEFVEQLYLEHFAQAGLPTQPAAFDGRSDYAAFADAGIAVGGLATGAEGLKSEAQAEAFGGEAGVAFDPCYHRACDTLDNVSTVALGHNARAAAAVLETLAADLGPLASQKRTPAPTTTYAAPPTDDHASGCTHPHAPLASR